MPSDPGSKERQCQNLLKDFWERFRLKENLKGQGKKKKQHSSASVTALENFGWEKPSPKRRGCSSTPCRWIAAAIRQPSPALPPPAQTGRDTPRVGGSRKGPPLREGTVRWEATAGRGPGGGERSVRSPRSRSRCQVRGKRRFLRTSGTEKRSGLPTGCRKREPGAAAGSTDSEQAASPALLVMREQCETRSREGN